MTLQKIRINLQEEIDNSYDITLGNTLFPLISESLKKLPISKLGIITDSIVKEHYGNQLLELLKSKGIDASLAAFPSGEEHKSRQTKEKLEDVLLANGFKRDCMLIALGGGVVGDLCGYLASTYMRGVPYIQIPTTLLGMVDSSIGGKTGINTPFGKNTIGTFYQPKAVFMDTSVLKSLPKEEILNGAAEMIKHAIIKDQKYFIFLGDFLDRIIALDDEVLEKAIAWSCEIKKEIVQQDEKEESLRKSLNLGHTVGHAIEKAFNYSLKHGQAVALGIIVETKIAHSMKLINSVETEKIITLINRLGPFPSIAGKVSQIVANTSYDKKNTASRINYVLPRKVGKVEIDVLVDQEILEKVLGELG
jgi:3-dehydroquinate synthase